MKEVLCKSAINRNVRNHFAFTDYKVVFDDDLRLVYERPIKVELVTDLFGRGSRFYLKKTHVTVATLVVVEDYREPNKITLKIFYDGDHANGMLFAPLEDSLRAQLKLFDTECEVVGCRRFGNFGEKAQADTVLFEPIGWKRALKKIFTGK